MAEAHGAACVTEDGQFECECPVDNSEPFRWVDDVPVLLPAAAATDPGGVPF